MTSVELKWFYNKLAETKAAERDAQEKATKSLESSVPHRTSGRKRNNYKRKRRRG